MSAEIVSGRLLANVLKLPGLAHAFTTRHGGISQGPFASLNLKYPVNDQDEVGGQQRVYQNRQAVCQDLGLSPQDLVACQQTHSDRIQLVTSSEKGRGALSQEDGFADTDGLITAASGVLLMVMVADCYPVLMADPVKRVAAAVHSGWRGTQQQIARKALQQMKSQFGSRPEDIRLAIGPGIGFERFEVGAEVVAAFADQIDTEDPKLVGTLGAKFRLNLPAILCQQALAEGLLPNQIETLALCTLSDARFFSYRREGGITGRQAGLIGWL